MPQPAVPGAGSRARAVRPDGVVERSPLLYHDTSFLEVIEDLAVQGPIAEPSVEGFVLESWES